MTPRKPVVVVLCGLPHVGKTTFARQRGEAGDNFTIVNPDEISNPLQARFAVELVKGKGKKRI